MSAAAVLVVKLVYGKFINNRISYIDMSKLHVDTFIIYIYIYIYNIFVHIYMKGRQQVSHSKLHYK